MLRSAATEANETDHDSELCAGRVVRTKGLGIIARHARALTIGGNVNGSDV